MSLNFDLGNPFVFGSNSLANAGFPEAGFAAALGVQLGGACSYKGIVHQKPVLGSKEKELAPADIAKSIRLMWATSVVTLILVCSRFFLR